MPKINSARRVVNLHVILNFFQDPTGTESCLIFNAYRANLTLASTWDAEINSARRMMDLHVILNLFQDLTGQKLPDIHCMYGHPDISKRVGCRNKFGKTDDKCSRHPELVSESHRTESYLIFIAYRAT